MRLIKTIIPKFVVMAILSTLAAACNATELASTKNTSNDGLTIDEFNTDNPITRTGFVEYAQKANGNSTYLELTSASFFEYYSDVTDLLAEIYSVKDGFVAIHQDACYTNKRLALRILWQARWPIRAGSEISFSDGSGHLLSLDTIQGIVGPDDIVYKSRQPISKTITGDLHVDIPGDVFPNFDSQNMPSLPSIKDLKVDNEKLNFTWTPSQNGGYLSLTFFITPDPKSTSFYVLGCNVVDDGAFSLTDTEHADGSRKFIEAATLKTRVVRKNQSALFLTRRQHFNLSDL